jgi:transposase InsO family protein
MPSQPWQTLHADLCGPFPSGESLLVMVDTCSRWPEVHVMKSTRSTAIIKCMKTTFATHGIPHEIVTDNGPQFTSAEVSTYLSNCGIVHRKVTPFWPQANSEVERFN